MLAMSVLLWVGTFALTSLFWCWIIFWGGAEALEGTCASLFLVHWFASRWSAEGIRIFAWGSWIISGFWFVIGLFVPEMRFHSRL
jgi:hypothetical protein